MYITIQFKDAQKVFKGKTYDYELCADEPAPKKDDIVRMTDENWNYIHYGTRVKVIDVKQKSETAKAKVRLIQSTL